MFLDCKKFQKGRSPKHPPPLRAAHIGFKVVAFHASGDCCVGICLVWFVRAGAHAVWSFRQRWVGHLRLYSLVVYIEELKQQLRSNLARSLRAGHDQQMYGGWVRGCMGRSLTWVAAGRVGGSGSVGRGWEVGLCGIVKLTSWRPPSM